MSDFNETFRTFYSPEPDKPIEEVALEVAQRAFSKAMAAEFAILSTIGVISSTIPHVHSEVLRVLKENVEGNKDNPYNHRALEHIVSMIEGLAVTSKQ